MSDARIHLSVSGAAEVNRDFSSVQRGMAGLESAASSLRSAMGTIGASMSVAAMAAFIHKTLEGVDALNDLKDATGASIENISALEDVARRTGAGIDTVSTALIKLNQGIANAKPGTDAAKAISAIGLSVKELKALDPAEAMLKTAQALSGFADDANKARLVQELFGKSMKEVAPLLKDLADYGELNATVLTSQAEEAEKFNKQLFNLQKNATDASRSFVGELVPTLNALAEAFTNSMKSGNGFSNMLGGGMRNVLQTVGVLVTEVTFVLRGMASEVTGIIGQFSAMGEAGGVFTKAGRDAWSAAGQAMREDAKQARRDLDDLQARIMGLGNAGRGTINPNPVDGRPSAGDITGGDGAAKAAAAELQKQQDLLQKLSGYTAGYTEEVQRLVKMQASGKLSQEAYNIAVNDLVNSQPGVKAVLDERAKGIEAATKAGIKAYEDETKAHDDYIKALNASADSVAKQVQSLQDEEQAARISAAQNISLAEAIEQVELARLQEAYAKIQGEGADGQVLLALQKEIEARRKLMGLVGDKAAREANLKGAKDAQEAWQKTADSINQTLTDALMRGWESGKSFAENFRDTVVNMFKTTILRPVISAIVNPVSMGITGMLGMGGAASAATAADGINGTAAALNGASLLSSMKGWLTDFGGGVASQVSKLGNYLSSFSNSTVSGWGEGLMNNATSIGQYAQMAGNALGYINAAVMASQGKWGAAVGAGIGTYFGGPIGSALGGAIGGWVDNAFGGGHEYTTGTGLSGTFSGSGFSGRNYQDWRNDGSSGFFGIGGSGSSSGTNYSAISAAQTKGMSLAFANIKTQTADFAKALGLSADTVQGFSKSIRVSLGSDAEANKSAIAAMFKGLADEIASTVLDGQYIREGEAAADTLARLATNLTVVNGSLDTLGKTLLSTSQASGDMASALIDQMGGLQQFQSSMASYYQTYYSEEERLAKTREQTTAAFTALGIAMPDTLQSFRDLVNVQDLTTESGRSTYAALIGLSGVFASITSTVDALTPALVETAKGIKALVDSIGGQRTAVAGAASSINPSPVMSLADIQAGLAAEAARSNTTGLNSAQAKMTSTALAATAASAALTAAQQVVSDKTSALSSANTAKNGLVSYYATKNQELRNLGAAYSPSGTRISFDSQSGFDNAAYNYNASTNRLNPFNFISYQGYTNTLSNLFGSVSTSYNPDVAGMKNNPLYRQLTHILDNGNSALATAATNITNASAALTSAQASLVAATNTKTASDVAAKAATLAYASAVDAWVVEASKSVPALSKLREETLRYYESQKELAELMTASSSNLRDAVAAARATQLDSTQLMRLRQRDFGANYSLALSTTGSMQAAYADKMAAALPDLADGLMSTAKTREEWIVATQTLYAQSERVAALLEANTPVDYQAESLDALATIDNTLALLDDSTRAITRAIESSGTLTAAGLRQVVTALGGTPSFDVGTNYVPRDMLARIHEGEAVVPRAFNPAAGARMGGGMSNTARLEALVEKQALQLEGMRTELRAIAVSSSSTAKTLRDITPNRTAIATEPAA